jgi:hypothetical protein
MKWVYAKLIVIEYGFKNILKNFIFIILTWESCEVTNIRYEWYVLAYERTPALAFFRRRNRLLSNY